VVNCFVADDPPLTPALADVVGLVPATLIIWLRAFPRGASLRLHERMALANPGRDSVGKCFYRAGKPLQPRPRFQYSQCKNVQGPPGQSPAVLVFRAMRSNSDASRRAARSDHVAMFGLTTISSRICNPPLISLMKSASCRGHVASAKQQPLGRRQLRRIVTTREQVSVGVHRHCNRGVADPFLHDLARQFQASVSLPVDAPGCEEVPAARACPRISLFWQARPCSPAQPCLHHP
jgi:hypothetical protein